MKAVVSFSGGVDSTTCLAKAVKEFGKDSVVTVSIKYGQKHPRELRSAELIAKYYGVKRYELDLSNVFTYNTDCSLLASNNIDIEKGSYDEQYERKTSTAITTSVPFRNGLFVAALVSFSQSLFPEEQIKIYLGNHRDGDTGKAIYPDCSQEFSDVLNRAIRIGTSNMVELVSPFADKTKAEIVREGLGLAVPYNLTWSCYEGGEKPCGQCGTCIDAIKAFAANDIDYMKYYTWER